MTKLLVFFIVGRVSVFFLQKFPITQYIKIKFLKDLIECDLCLGVWVYSFFSYVFEINLLSEYLPTSVLTMLLSGAMSSLVVHLIRIGWQDKFGIFEVK